MPNITLNYDDETGAHFVAANDHRNAKDGTSLTPKQRFRELGIDFILRELAVEETEADDADLLAKRTQWEKEINFS